MNFIKKLTKGLFKENPVFGLMLGLCPALAVSSSVQNALGMGMSATFVLCCSSVIVSLVRNIIPKEVRIPCFIVIIATFVTVVQLLLQAYLPALNASLGIFVPLIVVNCIILGRAEAFASKQPMFEALLDAVGMGIGFTFALAVIATFREILGAGKFFGIVLVDGIKPSLIMILAPGALLTMGFLLALMNYITAKTSKKD